MSKSLQPNDGGMMDIPQSVPQARIPVSTAVQAPVRVLGLDAVRGVCAIGVACYHTMSWSDGAHLYGMGLYGVYVFFVLSGASLFLAYGHKLETGDALVEFMVNRLLRLLPLMAVVALVLGLRYGDWTKTWLTASMLLGLANPGATSSVTGAWSLGIEFVFYLVFPVLCALVRHRLWWVVAIVLLVSQRLYIESVLAGTTLSSAWTDYTQPLSFASFFFVGCCIGRAVLEVRLTRVAGWPQSFWWSVCVVSMGIVGFYPAATPEEILLGSVALAMTLLTFLIVFAAAMLRGHRFFKMGSQFLGDIVSVRRTHLECRG